jgi:hypothetical protein
MAGSRHPAAGKVPTTWEGATMTVKFNQYWTIDQRKAKEYEKFVIQKYIPGMNRLGVHTVAGWTVLIGAYSEIIFEGVSNDLDLLEKALRNEKYDELVGELHLYIKKYKTKVLISTGKKEAYSTDIKEKTVKFNQMWDIISAKKAQYEQFVLDEYYPCLEELSITVAGEWQVLIGDGPHIICEGRAQEVDKLITNLQSKAFQKAKQQLKQYVENYESRILTFHIHKIKGYKSASYNIVSV